jgi:hypothetical protein
MVKWMERLGELNLGEENGELTNCAKIVGFCCNSRVQRLVFIAIEGASFLRKVWKRMNGWEKKVERLGELNLGGKTGS